MLHIVLEERNVSRRKDERGKRKNEGMNIFFKYRKILCAVNLSIDPLRAELDRWTSGWAQVKKEMRKSFEFVALLLRMAVGKIET